MNLGHAAARMQELLTYLAEQAAWDTGACQRSSPLAGATLVQALVLGYLADPGAALEDLAQTAALLGHPVTPQAIDQRFTRQLAGCLERLLGRPSAARPPPGRRPPCCGSSRPCWSRTVPALPCPTPWPTTGAA